MGLFSKRTRVDLDNDEATTAPVPPPGIPGVDRDWDRQVDGPFDISEVADVSGRLDCGVIALPVAEEMKVQFPPDGTTKQFILVNCFFLGHQLQVQAFAAPKSSGIWDEIRGEIVANFSASQGQITEEDGVLGRELLVRMPAADGGSQTARFFGIDGPKWFLRAVLTGPAALDADARAPFTDFLRGIVVHRGEEPRPPREVLALTPPKVKAPEDADQ